MHEASSQPPFEGDVLIPRTRITLNTLEPTGQRVFLTFGQGCYRRSVEVSVCDSYPPHSGVNAILRAIAATYELLPTTGSGKKDITYIVMGNDQGNEQTFADTNYHGIVWLSAMLISAEIIDVSPAQ